MNKLFSVKLINGDLIYMEHEEYSEMKKVFELLGTTYQAEVVTSKTYRIDWYNYMDEEWDIIWCSKDEFESTISEVIRAEVEFYVTEYN